ncbi:MAG: hypothetical protein DI498_00130 [Paracoccus denitrificans]|nr:MAG: hypothetical protein DI498_00130 [Paracoccus denitrificans]PZO86381.1 MAG: hypothetical protein DI633_00130 [Paracoccus denitrificans]
MRFETPVELYLAVPEINELTQQRPRPGESGLAFLLRLRASTTPEEGVTFTAFAAYPQMAIGWGYECIRLMADLLNPNERPMMEMVAGWLAQPGTPMRHRVAHDALWAPARTPSVFLGLAVAWSGGGIAPNDTASPPLHRTPRAVNSAVLSCLARADLNRRPILLARFIDMAEPMFRVY